MKLRKETRSVDALVDSASDIFGQSDMDRASKLSVEHGAAVGAVDVLTLRGVGGEGLMEGR